MAVTINASTSAGLQLSSDTSGEIQFQKDGTTNIIINPSTSANTLNVTGNTVVSGDVYAQSFIGFGAGFQNMNVISTQPGQPTQTWTVPTGVKKFKVTLIGAGGQGGGVNASTGNVGYGGGSGGVCIGFYNTVAGVTTVSMNVAQANGVGAGVVTNANGFNGFSSNVNYNGTWMFANGGTGGANSYFAFQFGSAVYGTGGAASGGTFNFTGNDGGSGGTTLFSGVNIYSSMLGLGICASTPLGFGINDRLYVAATGAAGLNGAGYGTGGGGGKSGSSATARAGGTGANGVIIIEW